MKKYFKISLAVATAVVMMLAIFVFASAAETVSPDLRIAYCNLSFENDTHIMYAVKSNDANVKLLVWDAPQTEYALGTQIATVDPLAEQMDINGEMHTIFKYTGLAAKQMTDDVYVRTCINNGADVAYGAVHKYSILQYSYNKLGKTGVATTNEKLIKMLNSLLDYGASAQEMYNYKTDRLANANFVQIKLADATLSDGFKSGLYLEGDTITLRAPEQNDENVSFTRWRDSDGNIISSSAGYTFTVGNTNNTYTPEYLAPTEGLKYTLINNGTEYSVSRGTATDADIIIPATYEDKPVTAIGEKAFQYYGSITYITIPDSVTSIGNYAFYCCSSLTSINIPDKVTSIGNNAFCDCESLTSITFGESSQLESIGNYAFSDCSNLMFINIPEGVTSIGYYAFNLCVNIKSIYIPNSVTSIGTCAFINCRNLVSITVDPENTVYHSNGNCLIKTETKELLRGCNSSLIPNDGSVMSIGSYAFYGCGSLTTIIIPSSVTNIEPMAFNACYSLINITVDSQNAVYHSNGNCLIKTATKELILGTQGSIIPNDGSVIIIGKYAFGDCFGLTSINIPESITSINSKAFYGCMNLMSVTIPNSLTNIASNAFSTCPKLYEVKNNSSIVLNFGSTDNGYIAYRAKVIVNVNEDKQYRDDIEFSYYDTSDGFRFACENGEYTLIAYLGNQSMITPPLTVNNQSYSIVNLSGVKNLTIPSGFTSINSYAFSHMFDYENSYVYHLMCTNPLTSITIPASVVTIGDYTFSNCRNLTDINFSGTKEQWEAIEKGSSWNSNTGEYVIHCTDGDIPRT